MLALHSHLAAVDFARQNDDEELVIPEDLSGLSTEDLGGLLDRAVTAFDGIYADGSDITDESLEQLDALESGIAAVREELGRRESEQAERSDRAAEIASRVRPEPEAEADDEAAVDADCEDCDSADETDGEKVVAEVDAETGEVTDIEVPDDASEITEAQPEPIAASGARKRKPTRINLSGIRSSQARTPRPISAPQSMADIVMAAPDMPGFANGQGMDWSDIGRGIDRRLQGYNQGQFARAADAGRTMRQQYSVAAIRRPFTDELTVQSDDPGHVAQVIAHAVNEHRLPGGSLVASGGWCAPSETVYDLCQLESRDGMLSIPEIGVSRGGIRLATGPSYADIFNDTGFCYTEEEDQAGDYDGEGGGSKPCFTVECPDFEDYRLNLCGTCIQAGLLQARGYPETISRVTSGALIAHEHRVNGNIIRALVAGSTAVSFPAPQAGALAPILEAIELQAEFMRDSERMSRSTSMEGVFPYWVRGLVRADLSRRLGVDLLSVPDSRITAWFAERGINAQFVYDWQGLSLTGDGTAYPTELTFLLYPAGAWVKGGSDIISLDTMYDSTLLGTNDYSALFFEESWLVAPQCGGSRVITVPVCPSGSTHSGELIDCDGTAPLGSVS